MKKALSGLLLMTLLFSLAACDRSDAAAASSMPTGEYIPAVTAALAENPAFPTEGLEVPAAPESTTVYNWDESFSFEDLKYTNFRFCSGSGGWQTNLIIASDGSFSGVYHDSNMGDAGEDHPNGSASHCDFTGRFSQPEKVDDYTYSVKLLEIGYAQQPDTQEILNGMLYTYQDAYGLEGTEEFLIFLPGAPLETLPEYYLRWVGLYSKEETTLPFYGLWNVDQQNGFSGSDLITLIRERVSAAESEEQYWLEIANDANATQADMNDAAQARYQLWDGILNELWAVLNQVWDEEPMRQLTRAELIWIETKESTVAQESAQYEGGSLYPTVYYGTAAELTKERVYELLELLS